MGVCPGLYIEDCAYHTYVEGCNYLIRCITYLLQLYSHIYYNRPTLYDVSLYDYYEQFDYLHEESLYMVEVLVRERF